MAAKASKAFKTIEVQVQSGVGVVWLNRPAARNAFDDTMVAELTVAFERLDADRTVRAMAIAGRGTAFCAGGDMAWLARATRMRQSENEKDAIAYARMLAALDGFAKPTIARVHGAAFAGGLGLICACDIAIASTDATFAVSEVRVGLNAATIAPYVLRSIGARQARRYVLSAERFTAAEAYRIGLVHELVPESELDSTVNAILGELVQGAPGAQLSAKSLLRELAGESINPALVTKSAKQFAAARVSSEGKEGIRAFVERRKPKWHPTV